MFRKMFARIFAQFKYREAITGLSWVTPKWLTVTLSKSGYLLRGKVVEVKAELWKTTELSNIVRVLVRYSVESQPSLPTRFLLKYGKPGISSKRAMLLRQKENEFYTVVVPAMPSSPTPQCYDSVYFPQSGKSYLLLEDLSQTHVHPKHPLPPLKFQAEQDIDCLASFHAYWWNDPRLGQSVGKFLTPEHLEKRFRALNRDVTNFISFLGDRLSWPRRKILEDILAFLPELQKRQVNGNFTLIHGDAHCWNFLNPIDHNKDRTRLIDWEFWSIDVGTYDLAYLIAVHFYPEMRSFWERELVNRYYDTLISNGVQNYAREDCWLDYRVSIIRHMFTPILQWVNGLNARVWWHNLERIMSAFTDLNCHELLK